MQSNNIADVAKNLAATPMMESAIQPSQTAGTDVTDVYLGMVGQAVEVGSIYIVCVSGGIVAADATAVTFTVNKKTAGGGDVALGSVQTKTTGGGGSGNLSQNVPFALTLVAGPVVLAAQDTLYVSTTHLSTGTATPTFQICVFPSIR